MKDEDIRFVMKVFIIIVSASFALGTLFGFALATNYL